MTGVDAAVARTPARPGPGPIPDAIVRALDVVIGRRVDSLLAGDYRSAVLGVGTELAQVRPYEPGDDVRRIDWNVTARTRVPHVRVQLADRVLVTWLVLDTSASMTFGTAERRKADVAEGVALTIGQLATRRGNRLGILTFGGADDVTLPPRAGRVGLLGVLATLRAAGEGDHGPAALEIALDRAAAVARQRALVIVVSDFRGGAPGTEPAWRRPLLRLAARHEVLAIEIRDPREQELVDVGRLWLVDPETGRRLHVDTRSRRLRERFAAAAAAERAAVAATIASAGASHVVLSTQGDWLRLLVASLGRRRR